MHGATVRSTLIQLEIPHIDQGRESIRIRDTRPMYRVPQVTLFLLLLQIPSLSSLAFLHRMSDEAFIASFAFVLRPPISAAAKASG